MEHGGQCVTTALAHTMQEWLVVSWGTQAHYSYSLWTSRNIRVSVTAACHFYMCVYSRCNWENHSSYLQFLRASSPLRHGWTIFVARGTESRLSNCPANLSELKIAPTHKMWPCSVLQVTVYLSSYLSLSLAICCRNYNNG